jgi:hypothetical protein
VKAQNSPQVEHENIGDDHSRGLLPESELPVILMGIQHFKCKSSIRAENGSNSPIDFPVAHEYKLIVVSFLRSVNPSTVQYLSGGFCILDLNKDEDTKSMYFLFFISSVKCLLLKKRRRINFPL